MQHGKKKTIINGLKQNNVANKQLPQPAFNSTFESFVLLHFSQCNNYGSLLYGLVGATIKTI